MIKIIIAFLIIFSYFAGFITCLLINRGGWIHYYPDLDAKEIIQFEFTDRTLNALPRKKWFVFRIAHHRK